MLAEQLSNLKFHKRNWAGNNSDGFITVLIDNQKKKPSKANKFLSALLKAQIYFAYTKQSEKQKDLHGDDW